MHGVRRSTSVSTAALEEERRRSSIAAENIRNALMLRKQPLPTPLSADFLHSYAIVETALLSNPDEYSLWNFRKEVFLTFAQSATPDDTLQKWQYELHLTVRALRNHPKAYPAWQHRIWMLDDERIAAKLPCGARDRAVAEEEKLSRAMLAKDCRNFHGWAHRMRVRFMQTSRDARRSVDLERDELSFVESKINDDFANYSAWHHRSVLLPRVRAAQNADMAATLSDELDYVRQAFYTEPDVQSVWFYHRWLLAGAPGSESAANVNVEEELLRGELVAVEELLELEPEARHALHLKAHLLLKLDRKEESIQVLDVLSKLVRFSLIALSIDEPLQLVCKTFLTLPGLIYPLHVLCCPGSYAEWILQLPQKKERMCS